jgi:hypothetical protein
LESATKAASRLLGINPKSVRQLTLASQQSLGELNFVPVGDFDYFKRNFPRKGLKENLFERGASAYLKMFHKSLDKVTIGRPFVAVDTSADLSFYVLGLILFSV